MKNLFTKIGLISKPDGNEQSPMSSGRPQKNSSKLDNQRPEDTIVAKLKKGNRQAGSMPNDELLEWARSLCIKEELIEWYLNPEFASTIEAVSTTFIQE